MALGSPGARPFSKGPAKPSGPASPSRPQLYVPDPLAQTGEYTIFGLTRASELATARRRRRSFTVILFGVATIVAVLFAVERYFYFRLFDQHVALVQLVPAELVFTYAWALLTPMVMWTARRFPVRGRHRGRNVAVQVTAMHAFVLLHVAMFTGAVLAFGTPPQSNVPVPRLFSGYLLSWFGVDVIVFCTLVAVHHAVIYYRVSQDRALRASQLEARLAQSQLQTLRMQLQPHFLFNTLNSISTLMHRDVKRADSMIVALSDLLRMSLRSTGRQEVPLQEELEFLERYLEIMTLRFGDRLAVDVQAEPEVLDARVPSLVLQPLVENAIRHGFQDARRRGHVTVDIIRDGDVLRCSVADDGCGLPDDGFREGVGLTTTRARLRHLYGEAHQFDLRNRPEGGARATLAIPYHPFDRTAAD
jgi:two-component system, LytTR family, sensor kinase